MLNVIKLNFHIFVTMHYEIQFLWNNKGPMIDNRQTELVITQQIVNELSIILYGTSRQRKFKPERKGFVIGYSKLHIDSEENCLWQRTVKFSVVSN